MQRRIASHCGLVILSVAMTIGLPRSSVACPFCSAPSLTLSEQLAQSDAVLLVEWSQGLPAKGKSPGNTDYKVSKIAKAPAGALKVGDQVKLVRYRAAKKGDLFLLMGSQAKSLEWGSPIEVSQASFSYLEKLPPPDAPIENRLGFYLKYLEFPDPLVANDAYAEFANAPYKDIAKLSKKLPRERLRNWIVSADTPVTRLGLYGLLLGLCGQKADSQLMQDKITSISTDDFRLGIDGVMSGFLLITGDQGLKVIEDTKLRPTFLVDRNGEPLLDKQGKKRPVPFSETYAAMQALRFMWTYGDGRIPKQRLRESMRILLARPELADLVIADLARWKDWQVQDRLVKLYGVDGYDIPSIKRAIVRYMYYCSRDVDPKAGDAPLPKYAAQAKQHLEALEKRDPKTVREAKRFLLP
jgi:hypothetical protein